MSKAGRYLEPDEIRRINEKSDLKGFLILAHCWGTIFAMMGLFALWPDTLTFLLAVLVIGGRQLGLAIIMHDAAHGVLFKTPEYNRTWAQWLGAYPIFSEVNAYRKYHLEHHRYTQTKKDPDLSLSAPFPITRKSFMRKAIRDLTGQTTWKQRKAQFQAAMGDPSLPLSTRLGNLWGRYYGGLSINIGLLAFLTLLGKPYYYFMFWLLPFFTWHQFILRVRNIAEHAMVPDKDDIFMRARTTKASWWMRAILAPYWVNYHVEHHMMMYVPCYNLPLAHELLRRRGWHDQMEIAPNYWQVISHVTSRPEGGSGGDKEEETKGPVFAGIQGPIEGTA